MPVTDVTKDLDARTLTITADFAATPERVWAIYADPRQLEKIWGPPTFPATVVDHDLTVGGRITYFMTSPEGEKFGGAWTITEVDAPRRFAFDDAFADAEAGFAVNPDLPVSHMSIQLEATEAGTRSTMVTVYDSAEDFEQILAMGMEEGATEAINQIDGLLAAG